ncbi:hypothetical protein D9M72_447860 [compost metagenome]
MSNSMKPESAGSVSRSMAGRVLCSASFSDEGRVWAVSAPGAVSKSFSRSTGAAAWPLLSGAGAAVGA